MRYGVQTLGVDPSPAAAQSLPPYALLHYVSTSAHADPIVDPDFNFGVLNSLKLRRVTEYCQWVETYDEKQVDQAGNKVLNPNPELTLTLISNTLFSLNELRFKKWIVQV